MKVCRVCKEFKSSAAFPANCSRCKLCDKKAGLKYKESKPEAFRLSAHKRRLKYSYNLDYEVYLNLCEEQNNVCKVCGENNKGWKLAVDHDHSTGKVRGLLCNTCNRAIGLLKDKPEVLRKAANYLESVTH